jgi:putative glutamine amidotransferase
MGLDPETFPGNLAREIDSERDALELDLARRAHAEGKPLLGICRGQQVMNVALGGSLWVDIPSQVGSGVMHRQAGASRQAYLHTVEVCAGTRLADLLGTGQGPVNSIHHQAVERLAEGLVVNALAPDGLIEGLEDPCHPFFLGVQWHPEELYTQDPAARRLFQAFADALPR